MAALRSVIVFFDDRLLSDGQELMEEIPARIRDAVDAIVRNVPGVVLASIFPNAGSAHLRAPTASLSDLETFLARETLGSYELDEEHRFSGS